MRRARFLALAAVGLAAGCSESTPAADAGTPTDGDPIESCVQTCAIGCAAPGTRCFSDGQTWCNDCVAACHGAHAVACATDGGEDGGCVALRQDGCPLDPPVGFLPVCEQECGRFAEVQSCLYSAGAGGVRCRCAGGWPGWVCESGECSAEAPDAGDACDAAGLNCGLGFEDPGLVCVAPENQWVPCRRLRTDDVLSGQACPPTPPTPGTTCCLIFPSGAPDTCAYDGGVFQCVAFHWAT